MNQNDRRSQVWLEAVPVDETRSEDGKDRILRVRGYAIVFNSESERMGSVIETIDPRALDHLGDLNTLGVRMQGEHEGLALANSSKGTLRLSKDERGILIEADLDPRRSDARDLYYAVERGDVDKMSFGFRIAQGGEVLTEDGSILRAHVTRIEQLYEVSGVNWPAYRGTSMEAVAVDGESDDPADDEDEHATCERSGEAMSVRLNVDLEFARFDEFRR